MVLLEKCKERSSLGKINLGGRIILKRIFNFEWEKFKLIGVSQDGDNGNAFVNMIMSTWFPKEGEGIF